MTGQGETSSFACRPVGGLQNPKACDFCLQSPCKLGIAKKSALKVKIRASCDVVQQDLAGSRFDDLPVNLDCECASTSTNANTEKRICDPLLDKMPADSIELANDQAATRLKCVCAATYIQGYEQTCKISESVAGPSWRRGMIRLSTDELVETPELTIVNDVDCEHPSNLSGEEVALCRAAFGG